MHFRLLSRFFYQGQLELWKLQIANFQLISIEAYNDLHANQLSIVSVNF